MKAVNIKMKIFQSITENMGNKITLSFYALVFLTISCKNVEYNKEEFNSNYSEFYYLAPNKLYPMRFSCGPVKSGPLPKDSERHYLKVTDEVFMAKFQSLYRNLKDSNIESPNFDAKTQILIHFKEATDTICMGKNYGIIINGNLKQDSPQFFKLVNDKISENYSPR